jgi:hypothetical protein
MDKELAGAAGELVIPILTGVHEILKDRGAYEKVVDWVTRKQTYNLVLLGATGVGKSSFLKSLQGLPPGIRREERTDSVREVDAKLSHIRVRVFDTPGEQLHESKRKAAIQTAGGLKPLGLLNIVSYGYHEGSGSASKALEEGSPAESFLSQRREVELRLLREWSPWLGGSGGAASWLITVVTKADLWWQLGPDQPVLQYYREGGYHDALGEARNLSHSVRAYSSLNQLFYDVGPMSGYYSDDQRSVDRASLVALMLELMANGQ